MPAISTLHQPAKTVEQIWQLRLQSLLAVSSTLYSKGNLGASKTLNLLHYNTPHLDTY